MLKKMYFTMLGVLMITSISLAGAGIVAHDKNNDLMTRWDAYGNIVWQSGDVTHDAYQMETGPDGYLYLGMWVDDRVARIDPVTGARVSEIAQQQVPATDRLWDLTFGNDIDGDGIDDLWVAAGHNGAGDGYILAYGSASDYAGSSEQVWVIADVNRRTVALEFGPDVSGDGVDDLWVVDGDGNDSGNFLLVLNGVTLETITSWSLGSLRGPKDVEIVDGRVYVPSANGHEIFSFALDGTDMIKVVDGSNSPEYYVRQIQPTFDGKWLTANRFSGEWGGQQGGVTIFDGDWTNGMEYYSAAGTDFTAIASFPGGAYLPTPVNGAKVSDQTSSVSWVNPDPNVAGGVVTCDVYLSNNYPDYGKDKNDPNFLNYAVKVVSNMSVNTLDLTGTSLWPLQYGDTVYWRVDTRDSSAVSAGTTVGTVWRFTVDNSAPQVNAGDPIFAWLTDGTVAVTMAPTITDDGKPSPPAAYTVLWEEVTEDADVVINNPTLATTTVTITRAGTFELRLTVDDSELTAVDTVVINVYEDACAAAKGVPGYAPLTGDLNDDCEVDLIDLGLLAADWLKSTALTTP